MTKFRNYRIEIEINFINDHPLGKTLFIFTSGVLYSLVFSSVLCGVAPCRRVVRVVARCQFILLKEF